MTMTALKEKEMRKRETTSSSTPTETVEKAVPPLHKQQRRLAKRGDIVTIQLNLTPENGYVPTPLFDTSGKITLVLGWGNYLPGLHTLLEGMSVGDAVSNVSIDAGWGERNPNLVVKIFKNKISSIKDVELLKVGSLIYLEGGIQVSVVEVTDDSIVVDGNPPLAGASFECHLEVLDIQKMPESSSASNRFQTATFALGCFWGGELAFMRTPGVVGTKVGYTQGVTKDPTYQEVCTGTTRHREAILVVYDSSVVSYKALLEVALERLATTSTPAMTMMNLFDDDSKQYSHGVYHHSKEQKKVAEQFFPQDCDNNNKYQVEVLPAATFYDAEEYHQQYLLKGGQSAKKGCRETIRCFG